MADTATLSATAPKTQVQDIESLRSIIADMDGLAEEGFRHIEAIAKLGKKWLETPEAHQGGSHITLHAILSMIQSQAGNYDDLIGGHAVEAGCTWRHEQQQRWSRAMDAAKSGRAA
jgi:hypothetical protein